ncbi:hypothetical protein CARN8_3910001 [mine drainage metagenome]|uniref:Uncharacterized protein n=1 Tax=mine drainage metagenome TaxID=410659 RepID=A0A3P3ZPE8_9ZZZZ
MISLDDRAEHHERDQSPIHGISS